MKLEYKEYPCEVCGKIYKSWEGKNNHLKKLHPTFIIKFNCKYCGQEFKRACAKATHERICELNPNPNPLIHNGNGWKYVNKHIKTNGWKCSHCDLIFRTRKEKQIHSKEAHPKYSTWNKGLTKETSDIVKEQAEKQSKTKSGVIKGPMSEEHRRKLTEGIHRAKAEGKNVGGYRFHKSGHGKKCIYQGIFFDSSWEVAYYVYHTEHGVPLERNTDMFQYWFAKDYHKYLPDFKLNGNYIEVKGYEDARCKAKYAVVENLTVIRDVTTEIEYCKNKYGDDWLHSICEKVFN